MQKTTNQNQQIFIPDVNSDELLAAQQELEAAFLQELETFQLQPEDWIAVEDSQPLPDSAEYVQLAASGYGGTATDAVEAEAVSAEETVPEEGGGSTAPWLWGGAGLLLAGVAAAASGGSSGSDDSGNTGAGIRARTAPDAVTNKEPTPPAVTNTDTAAEPSTDTTVDDANKAAPAAAADAADQTVPDAAGTVTADDSAAGQPAAVEQPAGGNVPAADTNNQTPDVADAAAPAADNPPAQPAEAAADVAPADPAPADSGTEPTAKTDNAAATAADPAPTPEPAPAAAEPAPDPAPAAQAPAVDNTAPAVNGNGKQSGLTLDIAKHFYSADVIKEYIDVISKSGGTFIQLHLSDDDNYAFESAVLGQTVAKATQNADGTYTNPLTGKQFLSDAQIADIVSYANERGVEIVPEVDTPNHMDAIFNLLEYHKGSEYVKSIKSEVVNDEIDITDPNAIAFVQSLYSEVLDKMGGNSKHFHIGGDEFGYSTSNNHEFITYANTMADFLADKGLTTRMWNDGILKSSLPQLDNNIEVTYWSHDGNPGDAAVADTRRADRATMQDVLDDGHDALNYNWYYLYFVPDEGVTNAQSGGHAASDIQAKWNLNQWDGQSDHTVTETNGKVIGSSFTIWGENADNMNDDEIREYSDNALAALISKTNASSVDKSKLENVAVSIDDNTQDNQVVSLDAGKSELAKVGLSDTMNKSYSFVWLDGDTDDMVTLSSDWAYSGVSETKDNGVSYSLYKTGTSHHLYIDTDIPVEVV